MRVKKKEKRIILIGIIGIIVVGAVIFFLFIRPKVGENELAEPPRGFIDSYVYGGEDPLSYKNENVKIEFRGTLGYFRYVGDPENGLRIKIFNPRLGWGPFTADVRGRTNYTAGHIEKSGSWAILDNKGIRWHLYIPVTVSGRFEDGMVGHLYLWADNNIASNIDNSKINPEELELWDKGDSLGVTVSCYGDYWAGAPMLRATEGS